MQHELILVGGGGHACVVADAARPAWSILGFVDPNTDDRLAGRLGVPHLGDEPRLREYPMASVVLGFGGRPGSTARIATTERIRSVVSRWATVIHRTAWISPSATIGEGTVVMAGAIIQAHARVGAHAIINTGAIVEHDVEVGDHCQLAPGVVIGGGTRIGYGSYVGLRAAVRDHIVVGARAVIGMGSRVVKDVAPDALYIEGRNP